jgi:hypothetical protein
MGVIELASQKSFWRGIDYYEQKKVLDWDKKPDNTYSAQVKGSDSVLYQVHLDLPHPKRSTCTCPFAAGRRVICKHMVALYFTVQPLAYEEILRQMEDWEKEEERQREEELADLRHYVQSLTKKELQERLLEALLEIEVLRQDPWSR